MVRTLNNYEHLLLIEWAYWVKSEFYVSEVAQGPLAIKRWAPNTLNDDFMLAVDRVVAGLPLSEKAAIKSWYLRRVQDDERALDLALNGFSNAYQSVPVGLRPDYELLESRAQLFYRHDP